MCVPLPFKRGSTKKGPASGAAGPFHSFIIIIFIIIIIIIIIFFFFFFFFFPRPGVFAFPPPDADVRFGAYAVRRWMWFSSGFLSD